ncbi:Lrp/AsnC family transcriptional regulator [uncultured Desulfobulbus sp.]|jgi:Lrp/AsnC family transcriptional regulator for asnA, asnC and gidA|uniref:Lrp/AsnC family transcriptional regulator n=1 Tax=uncultured Desulfobulbus sp. TaxID=239745 RepID=UPI0029C94166|nr:Lrp/AsnC family transcriptional regulator [uncultured Desulfobulbus sp.]
MQIDATNLAIINHLKDGRASFKKIAEELSLAEGTVRSRVKKLTDEGVLSISGLVNPEALPDQQIVMVGVRVKGMDLVTKGEEFSRLRSVISVCVVTGQFDLIVTAMLSKDFGLLEFFTQEVATIDNVRSVETFVVYKSFNLKVPLTGQLAAATVEDNG